jgi:hypothetical protein
MRTTRRVGNATFCLCPPNKLCSYFRDWQMHKVDLQQQQQQ